MTDAFLTRTPLRTPSFRHDGQLRQETTITSCQTFSNIEVIQAYRAYETLLMQPPLTTGITAPYSNYYVNVIPGGEKARAAATPPFLLLR